MPQEPLPSTEQLVEIESIRNGVVVLKNGSVRQIIMVTGINFDLKSEEEQNIIIYSYQNLLNTLDFSLQFFVHSRKLNIDNYLKKIGSRLSEETDSLLRDQISEYMEFIKAFVEQNIVMTKSFFVIVPYDQIDIKATLKGFKTTRFLPFLGGSQKERDPKPEEKDISKSLLQLQERVDQVIGGLTSIGPRAVPLNTEETTELFYNLYNPATIEKTELAIAKEQSKEE